MYLSINKPVCCFRRWTRKNYAIFASLHKVVKIGVVTFTCTLVQERYQVVLAQTDSTSTYTEDVTLDEVEVSASQPLLWSELSRAVSVIEKKDIAALPAASIDDILERIPGLDIRQRGPDGVQSDISLNGGSFDQVLILLNGVNITDPQTGHYNLDLPVDLNQIQRIEILHGSAARILGTNAFSGAINIITTSNEPSNGLNGQAQIASGNWNQLNMGISLTYNHPSWYISGGLSRKSSDGYIDNTDYQLLNSHVQSSYHSETAGHFTVQLGYQQKAYGANSFYSFSYPNQYDATKTLFSALSWDKAHGKSFMQAQLYERRHHDRFELFRNNENAASWYTGPNYHLNDVTGGKLILTSFLLSGKTVLGSEIRNEHIYSNVLGENMTETKTDPLDPDALYTKSKNRTTASAFVDQTFYTGKLILAAGLSGNISSDFGTYWNGGLDGAIRITEDFSSRMSLNRSVRLPSFTDLYYKSATQLSNPDLKPEQALTLESGFNWNKSNFHASATVWHRWGINLIDWVKLPDSTKWESRNLTLVNATGINAQTDYQPANPFLKNISLNYTYQYMNKQADGFDSKYALDYLKHKIDLKLAFQLYQHQRTGTFSVLINGCFYDRAGTYTDFTSNQLISYNPYWLCDTRLSWKYRLVTVFADLNNVFNINYADFGGLTQPGRNFKIGLKITFQD